MQSVSGLECHDKAHTIVIANVIKADGNDADEPGGEVCGIRRKFRYASDPGNSVLLLLSDVNFCPDSNLVTKPW